MYWMEVFISYLRSDASQTAREKIEDGKAARCYEAMKYKKYHKHDL